MESAISRRWPNTFCEPSQTSTPDPSGVPSAPLVSSGTGARRWFFSTDLTTTSASAKRSSIGSRSLWKSTFVPASGKTRGASSASAASMLATASNGSMSAHTSSAPSTAAAADRATTTATISPANRTTSRASGGRAKSRGIDSTLHGIAPRLRSSATYTPSTPSTASASAVSIKSMRPWGTGDPNRGEVELSLEMPVRQEPAPADDESGILYPLDVGLRHGERNGHWVNLPDRRVGEECRQDVPGDLRDVAVVAVRREATRPCNRPD